MRRSNLLSIAWSWKEYERFGLSVRRREGGQVKPMQGTNRCAQERRLCTDLILRSTRWSRAPEIWLEWPVFAVTMERYAGSGQHFRQTRKLQASKPSAAIPDMAASGLLINCHARISGTDFLMLSNGISLSMPQRAII